MAKFIYYQAAGGATMRAAVRTRHRDGDLTVEPFFYQDATGKDVLPFQGGFKLRIDPQLLTTATGQPVQTAWAA